MNSLKIQHFSNAAELDRQFAFQVAEILNEAVHQRGLAYLAVSGGKTPQGFFQQLSQQDLPWDKIVITLADERWVPPNHQDSNERLVHEHLLKNKALPAHFVSLCSIEEGIECGIETIAQRFSNIPSFDAVILGMGEDGHTASLFPHSPELEHCLEDKNASVLMLKPKVAPHQRVTLTKQRLLNTRALFLHVVGAKKMTVLNEALSGEDVHAMPIRAFLHQKFPGIQIMFAPD